MKRNQKEWLLRTLPSSKSKFKEKCKNELLPYRSSMSNRNRNYIDSTLVERWLHAQVGKNFNLVYSLFIKRIQPKYLARYKESIFWYVARPSKELLESGNLEFKPLMRLFYINPSTNLLERYSEKKLKEVKPIFLSTKYITLKYSKVSQIWTSINHFVNLQIKDKSKQLNKSHAHDIDDLISQIENIKIQCMEHMNNLAQQSNNTEIILSRKFIKSIFMDFEKGLYQFQLLFEVEKEKSRYWKFDFEDNLMVQVKRVEK